MIRTLLVFWLIVYSLRFRTRPWNFFQLNHTYFNRTKRIFSKLDIDEHIPKRWHLQQSVDDGHMVPDFPVFVKPEWGQNSHGVGLAENVEDLAWLRAKRKGKGMNYLLQQAAAESREFEFFYVRSANSPGEYAVISLTETKNRSEKTLVVNGINNRDTVYEELTDTLSRGQKEMLWKNFSSIGCFYIARVGVKANSIDELVAGAFHVVEVNIFLPMPLMLLDQTVELKEKWQFVRRSMKECARLAAKIDVPRAERYPIFFRKLIAHYKVIE